MDLREIPGADTPWSEINKLLEPAERLTWQRGPEQGFLLAPKEKSRLAATVYHCRERGLPIQVSGTGTLSSSAWQPGDASVVVSGRHLVQINPLQEDKIEVGAGVLLRHFKRHLESREREAKIRDWIWRDELTTVGSVLARNHCPDLLHLELVTLEGAVVTGVDGVPGINHLLAKSWGEKGIITSAILRISPEPKRRVCWTWSAPPKDFLKLLKNMNVEWERLDVVRPGDPKEKVLILAEISGDPKEIETLEAQFTPQPQEDLSAPQYVLRYIQQQGLVPGPATGPLAPGEYEWEHTLTGEVWKFSVDPEALPKRMGWLGELFSGL